MKLMSTVTFAIIAAATGCAANTEEPAPETTNSAIGVKRAQLPDPVCLTVGQIPGYGDVRNAIQTSVNKVDFPSSADSCKKLAADGFEALADVASVLSKFGGLAESALDCMCDDLSYAGAPPPPRLPETAKEDRIIASVSLNGRTVRLHVSAPDHAGWASIESGQAYDGVWMDRSFDNGQSWAPWLGLAPGQGDWIPPGSTGWKTMMHNYAYPGANGSMRNGKLRACMKTGPNADSPVACTAFLPFVGVSLTDGADPSIVSDETIPATVMGGGRKYSLHYSASLQAAWASVENGQPGDAVWIDRGHVGQDPTTSWDGPLGLTSVPAGWSGWRTWLFSPVDEFGGEQAPSREPIRVCGEPSPGQYVCTPWTTLL